MNDVPKNSKNEPRDAFASQLNNKKPRGKKSWLKIAGIFIVLIAIGLGIVLKFTQFGRDLWMIAKDAPKAIQATRNPDLIFQNANSNIVNILLIGRDVNYKIIFKHGKPIAHVHDKDTPARSDTMILLSLDKTRGTMRMISFPRDARVHLPPNKYHVRIGKLNAAHAYGGAAMLEQTFHDDFGITVHYYAEIEFDGFKSLIDKVDGIDVDVIGALHRNGKRGDLNYDDNWANLHIHLKPGMQHLNGEQAHNYVRFRMDLEGDPGRIRRQQQVMRALAKKMTEQPILKIPGLVAEVRRSFKTDMTDPEIASAAFFAKSLGESSKIDPVTLFGVYTTKGRITLNRSKNIQLLSYVLGSTFNSSVFLENSPSTEHDELGAENDSSPGAQALLRAAGLLGPSSGDSNSSSASNSTSSSQPEAEPSSRHSTRNRKSKARIADSPRSEAASVSKPRRTERPHKIQELSVDSSTPTEKSSMPIRQVSPTRRETTESSPIPRPE